MRTNSFIRSNRAFVAAFVLTLLSGWCASQAARPPHGAYESFVSYSGEQEFSLASLCPEVSMASLPKLDYTGEDLRFAAPAPAVPLEAAEWKQWGTDFVTFRFDKLRDRQFLYVYYLWPPEAEEAAAEKHAEAVLAAVREAKALAAAFGVEYDISEKKLLGAEELYRWAAVPVIWNDVAYKFVETEYNPTTFAALVDAASCALQKGAFANFEAVENWSASAKQAGLNAAQKAVSKGPLSWHDLEPIASFIAVDQKLDIQGVEAEPVLTSKAAWGAPGW